MFNALEPWHLIIIVGVLVVLFGAKRLPGSARSLGRSMRIFRSEMAEARGEQTDADPATTPTESPAITPVATSPATAQPVSKTA
ncbi:MAG TPA: Sec-independent protein translocase subunit TatA [Pseudonocardiaceae bacterium]|jgi:sec-independent protein translocase protein TatA|nr:Sec-independent protein translocase subunit TatA [Pseudonocardiaceae bacterium]